MSELHSMPMFWAEFFADTEHMSDDAAHAYLFLIGHAWLRRARLASDDRALARMARVSFKKWLAIKPEVLSLWTIDGETWTQKRLTKEWAFVSRRAEDNRKNGSLGGTRSAAKKQAISTETAKQTVKQPTPTPTPTSTLIKKEPPMVGANAPTHSPPKGARGTRLPTDFGCSEDSLAFGKAKGLLYPDIIEAFAEFRDFWDSLPGQRGCKLDWEATWRNRLRAIAKEKAKQNKGGKANGIGRSRTLGGAIPSFLKHIEDYCAPEDPSDGTTGGKNARLLPGGGVQRS